MQVLTAAARSCTVGLCVTVSRFSAAPSAAVVWKRDYSMHEAHVTHQDMPVSMENPYKEVPKRCTLCKVDIDYKNTQLLSQFVSPYTGRIYGRHITGLCAKKQKQISKAIRRAQIMGFMPVTYKDPAFYNDPKICDIRNVE
ncbi:small ribosomal subunit protein bS18m [Ambystoma mexicanum]|uniref:small ribosomal subunit protein bS18m n=1 Tax=Ambystoma mexicanum TaxID=8296 RepID=UPI0037E843E1